MIECQVLQYRMGCLRYTLCLGDMSLHSKIACTRPSTQHVEGTRRACEKGELYTSFLPRHAVPHISTPALGQMLKISLGDLA